MIDVLSRAAPAAHLALAGRVLVDAGDGSPGNLARVERFLAGRPVELIALTHAHADHAGGAAALADRLGVPVALHADDRATLERDARRLGQPIELFPVDRALSDGDELPGGLRVVATPSQTPGHVAYWAPTERVAFTGDLLQADDVAWMPFTDDALDRAIAAIRRIAELRPVRVVPGHGPPVDDVPGRAAATIAVYDEWRRRPDRRAGHHARRMVAGWLALQHPRPDLPTATAQVAALPMVQEIAAVLGTPPREVVARTIDQLVGSGALAVAADGRLEPGFPAEDPHADAERRETARLEKTAPPGAPTVDRR